MISDSIVDGFGLRFVIFTQGCKLRCLNCHNPKTHDLNGGKMVNLDEIQRLWRKNPIIHGITISGGEPFLQPESVSELVRRAKADGLDVICYSGYTYEALRKRECKSTNQILDKADYLIDGPYIHQLRNLNLLFRGSSNQRIIDLRKTKELGQIVLYQE
ncbi:anaerobic ribonucleoside-triphosphate reductase activating protein [Acholeplasma hippikon]|nr:anaerobic ribonucleoside-triphosphate reductase activating protein [Acholeplasma hippikon]